MTVGLYGAISGAVRYYICVNLHTDDGSGINRHSCDTHGPVSSCIRLLLLRLNLRYPMSGPGIVLGHRHILPSNCNGLEGFYFAALFIEERTASVFRI